MDPTLAQLLTALFQKDQAIAALSAKLQEQAAEIERLTAAQIPVAEDEPRA